MFSREEANSYNDLMNELITKAAVLKTLINDRWAQYFPGYINPMEDINTWLNQVDTLWKESTAREEAKVRLSESKKMITQGNLYAKNYSPWLRNFSPLSMQDSIAVSVSKSSSLIIEHASRRVDFFFLSLLFFYNKNATIKLDQTEGKGRKLQAVHGTSEYKTQACHSAIASNYLALSITGSNIPIPDHLAKILNSTVELPKRVNDFDGKLEGKITETLQSVWRIAALKILNQASQEGHNFEPRKALLKFLIQLVDFFSTETIKANYWSDNASLENKLIYALQCIGTFYFLWNPKVSLEDYIHSQMRLRVDEISEFKEKKFFRINKYKVLSRELGGLVTTPWINDFFSMDLTDESKRIELRNDDFVLDVLDNLSCFEETFESAMDILTALIDLDYGFEESSQCHIQYRVNLAFSPLLGGVGYQHRLTYLGNRLFKLGNELDELRSLCLIRALYHSLKISVFEETCAESYSPICEDKVVLWEIPGDGLNDDPSYMAYCQDITQLIIQSACREGNYELCREAKDIIVEFIEQNMGNLFAPDEILYKLLVSVPIPVDINYYSDHDWCENLYIKINYNLKKIKGRALDQHDLDMVSVRNRLDNMITCIAVNQFLQLCNHFGLLNAPTQEKYNWYLNILDEPNEEIQDIIYLYNLFNGDQMWENDERKMAQVSSLTLFQDEQIVNKIEYTIDCSIKIQNQIKATGQFTKPLLYNPNINGNPELNGEVGEMLRPFF